MVMGSFWFLFREKHSVLPIGIFNSLISCRAYLETSKNKKKKRENIPGNDIGIELYMQSTEQHICAKTTNCGSQSCAGRGELGGWCWGRLCTVLLSPLQCHNACLLLNSPPGGMGILVFLNHSRTIHKHNGN